MIIDIFTAANDLIQQNVLLFLCDTMKQFIIKVNFVWDMTYMQNIMYENRKTNI